METGIEVKQGRGELIERVRVKSKELLGYEVDVRELRLMPYLQYTMLNSRKIDFKHVNAEERAILSKWKKAKYIKDVEGKLKITKKFWDVINEILFLGYVDLIS